MYRHCKGRADSCGQKGRRYVTVVIIKVTVRPGRLVVTAWQVLCNNEPSPEGVAVVACLFSRVIFILLVLFGSFAIAQPVQHPAQSKPPQTPRQALIEIITGGSKAIQKHTTVEIQQMISEASKNASDKAAREMLVMFQQYLTTPSFVGEKGLQTFDSGPVLLSFAQSSEKQKIEVHVEADDLSGDLDTMQLSIHWLKDGQEQTIPFMPIIIVGLKQQEKVWRLNEVGGNARLIVGDPKFFTDMLKFQESEEQDTQPRQKPKTEATEKTRAA